MVRIREGAFTDSEQLRPGLTRRKLTEEAAAEFARLVQRLRDRGPPHRRSPISSTGSSSGCSPRMWTYLPGKIFGRLPDSVARSPEAFEARASLLFSAMREGGCVGFDRVAWFNGGLFNDDAALALTHEDVALVREAAARDWAEIDPSIFGTLFALWPKADVVIGNPPFLGNKAMLRTIGEADVSRLRNAFAGRLPGEVDLVIYWLRRGGCWNRSISNAQVWLRLKRSAEARTASHSAISCGQTRR